MVWQGSFLVKLKSDCIAMPYGDQTSEVKTTSSLVLPHRKLARAAASISLIFF